MNLISIFQLRNKILATLLVLMALVMLPACSSTEEESTSSSDTKDKICDEADAGTQGCPEK